MHFFYSRSVPAIVLAGLLLALAASQAQAHALYAAHTWQGTVALVQFAYAGGDVPTYAKVEVYSPADAKVEFQNGRTDAQGRFAFMPDTPGQWRIIMADNMGHRVEHAVEYAVEYAPTQPPAHVNGQAAEQVSGQPAGQNAPAPAAAVATPGVGSFSMPLRIALGLSLIANMALLAAVLRRRQGRC